MLNKKPKKRAVQRKLSIEKQNGNTSDTPVDDDGDAYRVTTISPLPATVTNGSPSPSKRFKNKEESKMKKLMNKTRRGTDPGPGLNVIKSFSTSTLPEFPPDKLDRDGRSGSQSSIVVPRKKKKDKLREKKEKDSKGLDNEKEKERRQSKEGSMIRRAKEKDRDREKEIEIKEKELIKEKEREKEVKEKDKEKEALENEKDKEKEKEDTSDVVGSYDVPPFREKGKEKERDEPEKVLRFDNNHWGSFSTFYDETATYNPSTYALPSPASYPETAAKIVKLNIGGYKYVTTALTLTSRGENFFTTLLSDKFPVVKDEEGAYFIDRDGEYFKPLLSFLRTGELRVPTGMSKMCVEREAHFYLINLNNDGIQPLAQPTVSLRPRFTSHPSQPYILGDAVSPIRYDGVYLQKTSDGENLFAYYRFSREEGIVSIVGNAQNKLKIEERNRYEIIEGTFVFIRALIQRKVVVMMAKADPGGNTLTIMWRNPRNPQRPDDDVLTFFPSIDPVPGLIFSNQNSRLRKKEFHKLYFKDTSNLSITVVQRDSKHRVTNTSKRTATYRIEKEPLCTVLINDDFFSVGMISLGAALLETRQDRLSSGQIVCYIYLALEHQEEEEEDCDKIDIYTFLRTSSPPVAPNDEDFSSDEEDQYNDPHSGNRPERSLSQ